MGRNVTSTERQLLLVEFLLGLRNLLHLISECLRHKFTCPMIWYQQMHKEYSINFHKRLPWKGQQQSFKTNAFQPLKQIYEHLVWCIFTLQQPLSKWGTLANLSYCTVSLQPLFSYVIESYQTIANLNGITSVTCAFAPWWKCTVVFHHGSPMLEHHGALPTWEYPMFIFLHYNSKYKLQPFFSC